MIEHLGDLTWEQAKARFAEGALVLVPIGATEAHGPHLPLATDVYLSIELAERVAAALAGKPPAVIAPPIAYTVTCSAAGFAGTVSLGAQTVRAHLEEVIGELERHGARVIALINSHFEPEHRRLLRALARADRGERGARLLFADPCRKPWALELGEEFRRGDAHAGAYESSLLLASRFADRVRQERMVRLEPRWLGLVPALKRGCTDFRAMGAKEAYFGAPAEASAEAGERHWQTLVRMWLETIRDAVDSASSGL